MESWELKYDYIFIWQDILFRLNKDSQPVCIKYNLFTLIYACHIPVYLTK